MKNILFVFALLSALSLSASEKPNYKKLLIKQYVKVEVNKKGNDLSCGLVFSNKKEDKDIIEANFDFCLDMAAFNVVKDLAAINKNLSFDLRIASIFTDLNSSLRYNIGLVNEFKSLYKKYVIHSKKYIHKLLLSQETRDVEFLTNFFNGLHENNMLANYLISNNLLESMEQIPSILEYFINNPQSSSSFREILAYAAKGETGNWSLYYTLISLAIDNDFKSMTKNKNIYQQFATLKKVLTKDYGLDAKKIKAIPFGGLGSDGVIFTGSIVAELTLMTTIKARTPGNVLYQIFHTSQTEKKMDALKAVLENVLSLIRPLFTDKEWLKAVDNSHNGEDARKILINEMSQSVFHFNEQQINDLLLIK